MSLVLVATIVALSGCQNAPPASSTEVVTPLPFGGGASEAGQRQAILSGQATLGDKPLANAHLTVLDAVTNEEAQVISPGGGNAVASSAANLKTDAEGRFNLTVAGIAPGQVVSLVAHADGKTLTTLVSGDGETLESARQVQRTADGQPETLLEAKQTFTLYTILSPETTLLSKLSGASLRMLAPLKPKAAADVVKGFFAKMRAEMPGMKPYMMSGSAEIARVMADLDRKTGEPGPTATAALSAAMVGSGNFQMWLDFHRGTIESLLTAIKTRSNIDPNLLARLPGLKNMAVPGTGLTISLDERYLTVVTADKTVRIDLTDYAQLDAAVKSDDFRKAFLYSSATAQTSSK
jgi:hypothetical protein